MEVLREPVSVALTELLTANSKQLTKKRTLSKKKPPLLGGSYKEGTVGKESVTHSKENECQSLKEIKRNNHRYIIHHDPQSTEKEEEKEEENKEAESKKQNKKIKLEKVAILNLHLCSMGDDTRKPLNETKMLSGWFNQSMDFTSNKKDLTKLKTRVLTKAVERRRYSSSTKSNARPQQSFSFWQLSSEQKLFNLSRQEAIHNMRESVLKDLRFHKKVYRSNLFDLLLGTGSKHDLYQSKNK